MALSVSSRVVLNNGVHLPILGFGTYRIPNSTLPPLLKKAVECGYRLIDSAPGYKSDAALASFLQDLPAHGLKRSDIFVSSKLPPADHGARKCRESATDILQKLNVESLDLFLIHWPGVYGWKTGDPKHAELRKLSWLDMEQMYKEGKFAAIGVSNYTLRHLKELLTYCSIKPTVNQVEFHPYLVQAELLKFCKENDIVLQAYSSLGAAEGVKDILNDPVIVGIAKDLQRTPAQVVLRWALQLGVAIIPKSSRVECIEENSKLFDFSLTEQQVAAISGLNKNKHYCWDPTPVA